MFDFCSFFRIGEFPFRAFANRIYLKLVRVAPNTELDPPGFLRAEPHSAVSGDREVVKT